MAFSKVRSNGIIAMRLNEGDDLITVEELNEGNDVLIATRQGYSIRFTGDSLRVLGRATMGVRGVTLRDKDLVVGATVLSDPNSSILSVTENGYGKRSPVGEYRVQNRGGMGIITIKTTDRNGKVVAALQVTDEDEIMLVTDQGQIIRIGTKDLRVIGRNTQGVRLFNLADGEKVVGVERLAEREEEEENGNGSPEPPEDDGSRFHSKQLLRRKDEEPTSEPTAEDDEDEGKEPAKEEPEEE
jgi:DNA gyrase subunit A